MDCKTNWSYNETNGIVTITAEDVKTPFTHQTFTMRYKDSGGDPRTVTEDLDFDDDHRTFTFDKDIGTGSKIVGVEYEDNSGGGDGSAGGTGSASRAPSSGPTKVSCGPYSVTVTVTVTPQ